MESTQFSLYIDESDPACSLLAFPIVMSTNDAGKKVLQPQIRLNRLGSIRTEGIRAVFVNCFGFIESTGGDEIMFVRAGENTSGSVVTAAMLTLGHLKTDSDLIDLGNACLTLKVSVKKSATTEERIAFTIHSKPPLLATSQVIQDGGLIARAEGAVKCPGKISSYQNYLFRIMFVSLTSLDNEVLYRVPGPVSSFRNRMLYSIQLEVLLEVDVKPENHQCKFLTEKDGKRYASVWFHLCNAKKTNAQGKPRTIEAMRQKVKSMGLKIMLADLWGPTIVTRATGKMSKYMIGFFGTNGVACHPITKSSPDVAKILWSCSCSVVKGNAIIQGSARSDVVSFEDIQVKGAASIEPSRISKYNPFKKSK
ncbi:matrix protein [avian paramyxovirus 22]|uniref:Matrix protein n=1 Tax=avian paramyxovirus 22 TaxID=2849511 RepID=A0A5J6CUU3_9MONO|nr:matrix protein [Avian metaavulavirus 21]QEQ50565.1 matrix protein [avian paramyxovirus 22]